MKNFPRHTILLFVFLVFNTSGQAQQYGLRLSHIKFVSNHGYILKPTLGAEFIYHLADIDDRIQAGFTLGFFTPKARFDTFPSYGLELGGNPIFLPGYETVKKYLAITGGLTVDYKILDQKISPTVGSDFYAHFITYDNWDLIHGLHDTFSKEYFTP